MTGPKQSPGWWDRRELEHISDGTALHAGIGTPWARRIFVAATPAVVRRIGVDDHARRAVLLRDECFYPAEILPVAHQHDLAADINFHLFQLLEILGRPVVRIDHLRFDVS